MVDINEGLVLAFKANAEVLNKLNSRLEKQDMDEEEEWRKEKEMEEMEEAGMEKAALVKEIVGQVFAALKQGGLELDADKEHKVSGKDTWPMSGRPAAEDEEVPAKVRSETNEVQKPIVASQKMDHPEEEEEGPEEYPMEEDEEKDVPVEMKSMAKELMALKKSNEDLKKNMAQMVRKATEDQLRKMGFQEEKGLTAPKMIKSLVGDNGVAIKKAQDEKIVDDPIENIKQLSKMSYRKLAEMRVKMGELKLGAPMDEEDVAKIYGDN